MTASWGVYESVPAPEGGRVAESPVQADPGRDPQADRGRRSWRVRDDGDPAQGQGRAAHRPARRARAQLPPDRDRAVQRPGGAAEDPGGRLAVPDEAHRDGGGRARVPAGHRSAAGRPLGAGRRAAAAEAAVPGPARVRGRPHLLGRLGRGRGRSPGEQGVDDVAAGQRDAAGRRRGSRCPARHAEACRRIPGRAARRAVADRGEVRGVAQGRGNAGVAASRSPARRGPGRGQRGAEGAEPARGRA